MKAKIKNGLIATSNTCSKTVKISAIITTIAYLVGLAVNVSLDHIERRELKNKIKNLKK